MRRLLNLYQSPLIHQIRAYLCRRIRALPGGMLPIVALTANALAEERERCLAAGMDGYLTKPLEPETLYAELCGWLRLPAGETDVQRPAVAAGAAQRALPGFDAAKVRRWQDEFPDTWCRMVRAFVSDYHAAVTAIGAALDAGEDRPRARDLLHRLRGAGGALGAEELADLADRLERALADNGPIDADLRARFFASAEGVVKVLAGLEPSESEVAYPVADEPGCGERSLRMRELEALLETGNTRALDHLPWLERWLDTEAPWEARELPRRIETLDFLAALETLRGLEEGAFTKPQ